MFTAGADAVMLDLEDAVPPEAKATARAMVAEVLADQPAWVRVNAARTAWCAADLDAVAGHAYGIRIPKVESAGRRAVGDRAGPGKPIICAIESARGVLAAQEIAAAPGVRHLAMGGVDLQTRPEHHRRQPADPLRPITSGARVPGAPGSSRPSTACTRAWTTRPGCASRPNSPAHSGSSASRRSTRGRSTILHQVFTPTGSDIAWAQTVLDCVRGRRRATALRLPSGEFVDLPVADRARRLLQIAGATHT